MLLNMSWIFKEYECWKVPYVKSLALCQLSVNIVDTQETDLGDVTQLTSARMTLAIFESWLTSFTWTVLFYEMSCNSRHKTYHECQALVDELTEDWAIRKIGWENCVPLRLRRFRTKLWKILPLQGLPQVALPCWCRQQRTSLLMHPECGHA